MNNQTISFILLELQQFILLLNKQTIMKQDKQKQPFKNHADNLNLLSPQKSKQTTQKEVQSPLLVFDLPNQIEQLTEQILNQYLKNFLAIDLFQKIKKGKLLIQLCKQDPSCKIVKSITTKCYKLFKSPLPVAVLCSFQFIRQFIQIGNFSVVNRIQSLFLMSLVEIIQYRSHIKSISRGNSYFLSQTFRSAKDQKNNDLIRLSMTLFRMVHQSLYVWGKLYFPETNFGKIYLKLKKQITFSKFPQQLKFYNMNKIELFQLQTKNHKKDFQTHLKDKNQKILSKSLLKQKQLQKQQQNKKKYTKTRKLTKSQNQSQKYYQNQGNANMQNDLSESQKNIVALNISQTYSNQDNRKIQERQKNCKKNKHIGDCDQLIVSFSNRNQKQDKHFQQLKKSLPSKIIKPGKKLKNMQKTLNQNTKISQSVVYRQSSIDFPQDLTQNIQQLAQNHKYTQDKKQKKLKQNLELKMKNTIQDLPLGVIIQRSQQSGSKMAELIYQNASKQASLNNSKPSSINQTENRKLLPQHNNQKQLFSLDKDERGLLSQYLQKADGLKSNEKINEEDQQYSQNQRFQMPSPPLQTDKTYQTKDQIQKNEKLSQNNQSFRKRAQLIIQKENHQKNNQKDKKKEEKISSKTKTQKQKQKQQQKTNMKQSQKTQTQANGMSQMRKKSNKDNQKSRNDHPYSKASQMHQQNKSSKRQKQDVTEEMDQISIIQQLSSSRKRRYNNKKQTKQKSHENLSHKLKHRFNKFTKTEDICIHPLNQCFKKQQNKVDKIQASMKVQLEVLKRQLIQEVSAKIQKQTMDTLDTIKRQNQKKQEEKIINDLMIFRSRSRSMQKRRHKKRSNSIKLQIKQFGINTEIELMQNRQNQINLINGTSSNQSKILQQLSQKLTLYFPKSRNLNSEKMAPQLSVVLNSISKSLQQTPKSKRLRETSQIKLSQRSRSKRSSLKLSDKIDEFYQPNTLLYSLSKRRSIF